MASIKNNDKELEYKSFKEFSLAEQMINASGNDLWKNKVNLWNTISALCDEAAGKTYSGIENFAKKLIDIDNCSFKSLKSIAQSVDLSFVTDNIQIQDFPYELVDLIDLLSVQKSYLMDFDSSYLSGDIVGAMYGKITQRAVKDLSIENLIVTIDLIIRIKNNCDELRNVLNVSLLSPKTSLSIAISAFKLSQHDAGMTIAELCEEIKSIQYDSLKEYVDLSKNPRSNENKNPFLLLMQTIREHYHNEYKASDGTTKEFFIAFEYMDNKKAEKVNCRALLIEILDLIRSDNEYYKKYFIEYNIFNHLKANLVNEKISRMLAMNKKENTVYFTDVVPKNMYSEEEFNRILKTYDLDDSDITSLMKMNDYTERFPRVNCILKFAEYLSFINRFLETKLEYNTIFSLNVNSPDSIDDIILSISSKITLLVKQIIDARETLKKEIIRISFIGTNKIISDILKEFFIKNFSKEYINETILSSDKNANVLSSLVKDENSLLSIDNPFNIDLVEYYDTTEYLNIGSEAPFSTVKTENPQTEEYYSYYLDENGQIKENLVKRVTTANDSGNDNENIKDFNGKFWENLNWTANEEDYYKFYSQYDEEYKSLGTIDERKKYVTEKLIPRLSSTWDMFALKGYVEDDPLDEFNDLYKKYIGNDLGSDKYKNNANKVFPTIAPIQNIQNLVEITSITNDILILSKLFYKNAYKYIKEYTKKILRMYDENGVPVENWKQYHTTWHGYGTDYESSKNIENNVQARCFDIDGAIDWNTAKYALMNIELSGDPNFETIPKIDNFGLAFYNNNALSTVINEKIIGIEKDYDHNYFILYSNHEIYYRSAFMRMAIPLKDFSFNSNERIDQYLSNCIQFGLVDNILWFFSKIDNYSYDLLCIRYSVDEDQKVNFKTGDMIEMSFNHNNDFIGIIFNPDNVSFDILSIDLENMLKSLNTQGDKKYLDDSYVLNINRRNVSTTEDYFSFTDSVIKVKATIPMILKNQSLFEFDEENRIWKTEKYNGKYYICYETLNIYNSGYAMSGFNGIYTDSFPQYLGFELNSLKFEMIEVAWVNEENSVKIFENISHEFNEDDIVDSNTIFNDYAILLMKSGNDEGDKKRNFTNIYSYLKSYPICYQKNGCRCIRFPSVLLSRMSDDNAVSGFIDSILENHDSIDNIVEFEKINNRTFFNEENLNALSSNYAYLKEISGINLDLDMLNKLNRDMPMLNMCNNEKLKIRVNFVDKRNWTILHPNHLDLDLTCYIDDDREINKKVGYGNNYRATKYINWSGDSMSGPYEELSIDEISYAKNNPNKKEMLIRLGICWNQYSEIEINDDDVKIDITWNGLTYSTTAKQIGFSEKACDTESLLVKIDTDTNALEILQSEQYVVLKLALKSEFKGIEDGIPDVSVYIKNATSYDLAKLSSDFGWSDEEHYMYTKETSGDNEFAYVLLKDYVIYRALKSCESYLKSILDNTFADILKNYREMLEGEIFFGSNPYALNIDKYGNKLLYESWFTDRIRKRGKNYQIAAVLKDPVLSRIVDEINDN